MKASIERIKGFNYIVVDGKVIDTLSFKSFRPTKNNVSDFYQAGVRVFQVFCSGLQSRISIPYSVYGETWFGDGDYRFENLDRQIDLFVENAPEAYVIIDLHIDTRSWWLEENPGKADSFSHISQIAADEKWRKDTGDYIKALIAHVEEKYPDKVCGYLLMAGSATEWISRFDQQESHPIKLEAYKKYMHDESVIIPSKEEMDRPKNQIFLDPVRDKSIIDYQKFHAELVADTLLFFCSVTKAATGRNKIVGAYFGYIMELTHIWDFGHLAVDKVFRSKDLDFIASPCSYQFREYNDPGAYMTFSDTLELNKKIYFTEFDHMTFTTPELYKNPKRICEDKDDERGLPHLLKYRPDLLNTREQTIHVIQREVMYRLAKRTGTWWFDMLEGWFYDDGLMGAIKDIIDKSKNFVGQSRNSNSEIAVFVSYESLYYVNKHSKINNDLIRNQRDALARIGAPYDLYSFNDIDRVDKTKYKLCIFLDAFYMTDEQRDYINTQIKCEDRSVLFIGSADYVNDEGCSKERMEAMVGMKLDLVDMDETTIGAMDTLYGHAEAKTPTWYINDEETVALGRYNESRKRGLAKKKFDNYTVYFSGLGNIAAKVLREIAREADVHIYAENDTPTYIDSKFVGVYNTKNEFTEIKLKEDGEFVEFFSDIKYKTENGIVVLPTGEHPAQLLIMNKER